MKMMNMMILLMNLRFILLSQSFDNEHTLTHLSHTDEIINNKNNYKHLHTSLNKVSSISSQHIPGPLILSHHITSHLIAAQHNSHLNLSQPIHIHIIQQIVKML